jgi:hypothetical protein
MEGFATRFADLDDPRSGNAGRHDMLEMLVIAVCALLTPAAPKPAPDRLLAVVGGPPALKYRREQHGAAVLLPGPLCL